MFVVSNMIAKRHGHDVDEIVRGEEGRSKFAVDDVVGNWDRDFASRFLGSSLRKVIICR